jgi:hypothetical protein
MLQGWQARAVARLNFSAVCAQMAYCDSRRVEVYSQTWGPRAGASVEDDPRSLGALLALGHATTTPWSNLAKDEDLSAATAPTTTPLGQEARRCGDCGHRRIFHFQVPDNRANHGLRLREQPVRCSIPGCRCSAYCATEPAFVTAAH